MTQRAGISPAVVQPASPVARPCGKRATQSSRTAGPPARWIAPSTPPPPRMALLAALTTASTSWRVMSPRTTVTSIRPSSRSLDQLQGGALQRGLARVDGVVAARRGALDRAPLLVGVDHPGVDVRRARQGRRVAQERRDLLHRPGDGPLAR